MYSEQDFRKKTVHDSLMDHFRLNNLLSDNQFGFLEGRSANIRWVMDDWINGLKFRPWYVCGCSLLGLRECI